MYLGADDVSGDDLKFHFHSHNELTLNASLRDNVDAIWRKRDAESDNLTDEESRPN